MTALSFKAQFAGPVERREKRQSIRAANRFAVGKPIQLYTGMRTKACRKLVAEDPICTSIEEVYIDPLFISVGEAILADHEERTLATADGFASVADFKAFFIVDGAPFNGFLIKWDWAK